MRSLRSLRLTPGSRIESSLVPISAHQRLSRKIGKSGKWKGGKPDQAIHRKGRKEHKGVEAGVEGRRAEKPMETEVASIPANGETGERRNKKLESNPGWVERSGSLILQEEAEERYGSVFPLLPLRSPVKPD